VAGHGTLVPVAVADRRDVVTLLVTFAGWCGFAWYVFWQGTAGPALVWSDTTSYAVVAGHPVWSTGFWAGQRPPLVPLVLKMVDSTSAFAALQSMVAVAAWGLLAFTVGRLVPAGWRRVAAAWVVLAFATSTPIVLWNRSVLSESLSLSILAVLVASVMAAARRITWPRVAVVALAAVAFATTRDAQVWTVALLGVIVAIVALVRARHVRRSPDGAGGSWRRIGVLALSLLVGAGVTGWIVVHTGRSEQNLEDVLYVRVFPFPARVAWFAAHGMPEARWIDEVASVTVPPSPGAAKVVGSEQLVGPRFATLEQWMVTRGENAYLLWLVTHPLYVVTEPLERPERAFNFANGHLDFYAAVNRVDSPMTAVLWPAWWWMLPMTVVAVGAAAVAGTWRDRGWQAAMMLGGLGIFTILVAWHGDGEEVARHTVEGLAEVRVCVLVATTVAVLRVVPARRSRTRRHGPPVESPPVGPETVGAEAVGAEAVGAEAVGSETVQQ